LLVTIPETMSDTTYLVTGGAGFIGSALVRALIEQRAGNVVNIDKLTYAGNLDSLASVADDPHYRFEHSDICDQPVLRRIFDEHRPTFVVHLAAETHVDRSIDGPSPFLHTNVNGTFELLREAHRYWLSLDARGRDSFRFLHVSTDEVFGSLGETGFFSESTPYDPSSPYAASKASADHFVRAWQRTYGLPAIVSNCSNNFGPFQFPEKLIPLAILNALEGKPVPIYGRGDNVRDWLYVTDHVDALLLMLRHGMPGETYVVSAENERRNLEVATAICDLVDEFLGETIGTRRSLLQFVTDRPGHDHRYAIDPARLKSRLGWRPSRDFESGLRDTVHWYATNRDWWQRIRSGVYRGNRLGLGEAQ
jgi:dTDP-glucose 4,6-dehydratase